MTRRPAIVFLGALAILFTAAGANAQCPDPSASTCAYTIAQNPIRSACINNFTPDVVRLCPGGGLDVVTFNVTVLNSAGVPCVGTLVKPYVIVGSLNLSTGGYTTAVTGGAGTASFTVSAGSGCGLLGVCADDGSGTAVPLGCRLEARSPDVNKGGLPTLCGLPTTTSCVAGSDITNPVCGFLVKFGSVTPGVNNCWDLNCDNVVAGSDITGLLGKGGVLQAMGCCGTLGAQELCP